MKLVILALYLTFSSSVLFAQSILFNKEGGTPDPSAIMELRSTEQGFLGPRMSESQRLSISSPAQGLLIFQTDGTIGFYFYNGTGWDTLGGASTTVTNVSNVTNISSSNIAVVRDEKATGVSGGTFTSGSWVKRELNTLEGDSSFVELDADTIILDSGTYVFNISAPGYRVDEHQVRLYNCTAGSVEAVGSVAFSDNFAATTSLLTKVISVSSQTSFVVEHRCETTQLTNGLGQGASWGENTYTQVEIEKL